MRRGVRGLGEARRVEEEGRRRRRWRRRRRDGGGGEERKGDWGRGKAKARAAQGRQAGEGKGAVPVRAVSRSPRPGSLLLLFLLQRVEKRVLLTRGIFYANAVLSPHPSPAACSMHNLFRLLLLKRQDRRFLCAFSEARKIHFSTKKIDFLT